MALALFPISVHASTWFVSPQVSTLGLSGQLGYKPDGPFSVRAVVNQFSFRHDFNVDRQPYDSNVKLRSFGLIGDYYPWNNGFHLSAGLYRNDNQVTQAGPFQDTVSVRVGGREVQVDAKTLGNANTRVKWAPVAPYLGVGYHNVTQKGFSFAFDLGVLYQGSARVRVDPPASVANVNSPWVTEETERHKQSVEQLANKARWYPVLSLGIVYTF